MPPSDAQFPDESRRAVKIRHLPPVLWTTIALILLWQIVAFLNDLSALFWRNQGRVAAPVDWRFLSSPLEVLLRLPSELYSGNLPDAFLATLWHTVTAAAFAFALALIASQAVSSSSTFRRAVVPLFGLLGGVPPVTLLPLFLLAFRLSAWSVIALAIFGAFFSGVLICVDAFDSINPELRPMLRKIGYSPLQVRLWTATVLSDRLGSAARETVRWSLILSVVGEMHGSIAGGLGAYVDSARLNQMYSVVFVGIVACGCLSFLLSKLLHRGIGTTREWIVAALLRRGRQVKLCGTAA